MMDETPSTETTTTTSPAAPPAPYARILNMAEGRRKQLFGWLNERCVYIPQLDPTPPEDLAALTTPAPIEYARACGGGSTDAWLLVLHGIPRPYVIVPEDSLAADFVVRYQMLQEVPVHAVSVVPDESGGARPVPTSVHRSAGDLRSQQQAREEVLGPRRVLFTVESLSPRGADEEELYSGEEEDSYEEDAAATIAEELRELAYVMEEDAQWVVPLVEEELWRAYESGQMGPDLRRGLAIVSANAPPQPLGRLWNLDTDEVDSAALLNADGVLCAADYDDDLRDFSPYENPAALLRGSDAGAEGSEDWSENERRRRAEQERLRENITRGFQTFLAYLRIADHPAPKAQNHTTVAFPGEPEANGAGDPEAQQHENIEDGAAEPATPDRTVRFLDPNCIQRAISATEQQLTEGRWCLLTLHEFQAWRCEAQSPLIEASLLNALALEAKGPKWLLNPLEDRASSGTQRAQAVAESIRTAKPGLVAVADALERFLAVAKDAALYRGPENTGGVVHVDVALWEKIRGTAAAVVEAHAACFGVAEHKS